MLFGKCNLCGFPIVKVSSDRMGMRCVNCLSTQVHRAIGSEIQQMGFPRSSRVYELSSKGSWVRYLKKHFNMVYLSEFFEDVPSGREKNGIPCQDVQKLTFNDCSFDLVTSTEVFEHVANDIKGFSEVYRILVEGGYFIFTVPLGSQTQTVDRAFLKDGVIEHKLKPEYHNDRIRGRNKVLAFRNYGTDIVERLQSVQFSAEIKKIDSEVNCIKDEHVIIARK